MSNDGYENSRFKGEGGDEGWSTGLWMKPKDGSVMGGDDDDGYRFYGQKGTWFRGKQNGRRLVKEREVDGCCFSGEDGVEA
ncbi:hypothetical protein V6N13_071745 [Hibiscus sabdariffa]